MSEELKVGDVVMLVGDLRGKNRTGMTVTFIAASGSVVVHYTGQYGVEAKEFDPRCLVRLSSGASDASS